MQMVQPARRQLLRHDVLVAVQSMVRSQGSRRSNGYRYRRRDTAYSLRCAAVLSDFSAFCAGKVPDASCDHVIQCESTLCGSNGPDLGRTRKGSSGQTSVWDLQAELIPATGTPQTMMEPVTPRFSGSAFPLWAELAIGGGVPPSCLSSAGRRKQLRNRKTSCKGCLRRACCAVFTADINRNSGCFRIVVGLCARTQYH
jgi:hypothetical protein